MVNEDALPNLTSDIEKYSYSILGICCCAIHILCLIQREQGRITLL